MRPVKTLGFAAIAAAVSMAIFGTASVSANGPTALCKTHTFLGCFDNNRWNKDNNGESVHFTNVSGTVVRLLNEYATVLCLDVLAELFPLALANPQVVHASIVLFKGCGTNASHDNCTVSIEQVPLFKLLKLGLDQGSLEATSGFIRFQCPGINCRYNITGFLSAVGAQHITAVQAPFEPVEEEGEKEEEVACPSGETTIDWLLKTLATTQAYVLE